jgi:hypothetical protein
MSFDNCLKNSNEIVIKICQVLQSIKNPGNSRRGRCIKEKHKQQNEEQSTATSAYGPFIHLPDVSFGCFHWCEIHHK